MHVCLVILAYLMGKFYIIKDLLSTNDLQKVLSIDVKSLQILSKQSAELRVEIGKMQKTAQDGLAGGIEDSAAYKDVKKRLEESLSAIKVQYNKLYFQHLKTHIQKFKCAIEKRILKMQDLMRPSGKKSRQGPQSPLDDSSVDARGEARSPAKAVPDAFPTIIDENLY